MLSVFCPWRFGELFFSVVLGGRFTPKTTWSCSQWCPFFTGGVFECSIAHRQSVSVICMRYKICASAGYTRCLGRTSVHLCASSLQNLAVPHNFHSPISVSLERVCWPNSCIRWCMTVFLNKANAFLLALLFVPFRSPTDFPFCYFFLLVGIVGLGSLDW